MGNGVNFSVFSREATACTLVLYRHGQTEPFVEIPFPDSFRVGDVYAMMVFGLDVESVEYGYRFDGPYDPGKGLLYDKRRVLLDPYARSVSGRSVWGVAPDPDNPFPHRGQIIREDYDWAGRPSRTRASTTARTTCSRRTGITSISAAAAIR